MAKNIIDIIKEHSLVVRCLPFETINCWSYKEGDELKTYVNADGTQNDRDEELGEYYVVKK